MANDWTVEAGVSAEWAPDSCADLAKFDTIADAAAAVGFSDGQYMIVWNGDNGETETFQYLAASALTPDGSLVVTATGMGAGQFISGRRVYADYAEAKADSRTFDAGTVLSIRGVTGTLTATDGAGNWNGTNAGGQEFIAWSVIGDIRLWGASGDGVTDDTAAVQAAADAAGTNGRFYAPKGTYKVTSTVTLSSCYAHGDGETSTRFVASGMNYPDAIFYSTNDDVIIESIGFDGARSGTDASATGAGFGVYLSGGNGCRVNYCAAEEMTGSGFWFEDQTNADFDYNRTKNTGKDGVTNNHGILYNATSAVEAEIGIDNVSISHCRVENPLRKGIAGGSAGARIKGLKVVGNYVSGGALGGVYAGGTGGLVDPYYHVDCRFDDNVVDNCGEGLEVYNVLGGSISRNTVTNTTTTFFGIFSGIKDCRMIGNYGRGSYTGGWQINAAIAASTGLDFVDVGAFDVNTSGAPDAPRLGIISVTNSRIGRLKGDAGGATYDLVEYSGSTDNQIFDLDDAGGGSAGSVLFLNAASTTTIEYADGRKLCGTLTLATGANNDVPLPMQYDNFVINGPAGAYTVSGFSGVKEGRRVTISSNVGYGGTLLANNAASAADNRLIPASGANLALPILGTVDLTWMPGLQGGKWAVR